jgi:hypothetical protein
MKRVAALLLLLVGCGSGEPSASVLQARADCEAFITDSYCPKVAPCLNATADYCVTEVEGAMECATVVSENGELATCEADIANSTCSQLVFPDGTIILPPSCLGDFQR